MVKLSVVCDYFADSGYGCHSRNLVNALIEEGVEVSIICNRPQQWSRMLTDKQLKAFLRDPVESEVQMLITLPSVAPMYLSNGKPTLQYVVWEGDKIPEGWISILEDDRIRHIFVPSIHTQQAIINTCKGQFYKNKLSVIDIYPEITRKIKVIPHGVNLDEFYPKPELKDKKDFTFLIDKGWPQGSKDRGGVSFFLKAFLEEFTSKDNVKALIKINTAYGMSQQMMDKNLSELNIQNKDPPKLGFITQNIAYRELNNLYNQADVFVISSLAESFHIGGLQAMACGLPVLATDFGGQTDYVNADNGWIIPGGKMIKVDWDLMYEGISWKLPDMNNFRETLRAIYENMKTGMPPKKVEATLKTAKQFTWQNSAKKIVELL